MSIDISSISGLDQETFGASVVSSTFDTMNNSSQSLTAMDQQTFGASVVSKTFDYMNSGGSGNNDMNSTYQFSNDVLSGYMSGKGTIADINL